MSDRHPLREATREQMVEWAEMWEREAQAMRVMVPDHADRQDPDYIRFLHRNEATAAMFRGLVALYDVGTADGAKCWEADGDGDLFSSRLVFRNEEVEPTPWAALDAFRAALSRGDDANES